MRKIEIKGAEEKSAGGTCCARALLPARCGCRGEAAAVLRPGFEVRMAQLGSVRLWKGPLPLGPESLPESSQCPGSARRLQVGRAAPREPRETAGLTSVRAEPAGGGSSWPTSRASTGSSREDGRSPGRAASPALSWGRGMMLGRGQPCPPLCPLAHGWSGEAPAARFGRGPPSSARQQEKSPPLPVRERGPRPQRQQRGQMRCFTRGIFSCPSHTAARGLGTAGDRSRMAAARQSRGLTGLCLLLWAPFSLPQGRRGRSGAASPPDRSRALGRLPTAPRAASPPPRPRSE
ncbi:collagen, type I, alpha 1b-like [Pogoniulus pusillus]|uniref:collagen, type I, alpha 1b-like n=1 Tax=Pogoniulus pusillus TaxID=488313 RepID=UPI0030B9797F